MRFAVTVGGTDNTGGAGLPLDIKIFSSLGVYAFPVVTSVTVQDVFGVHLSFEVPSDLVFKQIEKVLSSFHVKWVKVSVVPDVEQAKRILNLKRKFGFKVVLDPVVFSKNGFQLSSPEALGLLARSSEIITPNKNELEIIFGKKARDIKEAIFYSLNFISQNPECKSIIVKGGHFDVSDIKGEDKENVYDWLVTSKEALSFKRKKIQKEVHGSGTALSSLLCAFLSKGKSLREAFFLAERKLSQLFRRTIKTEGFSLFRI